MNQRWSESGLSGFFIMSKILLLKVYHNFLLKK